MKNVVPYLDGIVWRRFRVPLPVCFGFPLKAAHQIGLNIPEAMLKRAR